MSEQQKWRLVPCEPTREMLSAARDPVWGFDPDYSPYNDPDGILEGSAQSIAVSVYHAMLAAAPSPVVGREEIAKIVNPLAWSPSRKPGEYMFASHVREDALAKADAILALLVAPRVAGSTEPQDTRKDGAAPQNDTSLHALKEKTNG